MQNKLEHKKVCGKWPAQAASAPAEAWLPAAGWTAKGPLGNR